MRTGLIDLFNDGTDFVWDQNTGIKEVNSVVNMPLIGLFGGNFEQLQPITRLPREILTSWWGNSYGLEDNSSTERLLANITLSSATPEIVKRSVLNDLSFLTAYINVECVVTIPAINRIKIDIYLSDKKEGRKDKYSYIWDTLEGEISAQQPEGSLNNMFDFNLDFSI